MIRINTKPAWGQRIVDDLWKWIAGLLGTLLTAALLGWFTLGRDVVRAEELKAARVETKETIADLRGDIRGLQTEVKAVQVQNAQTSRDLDYIKGSLARIERTNAP